MTTPRKITIEEAQDIAYELANRDDASDDLRALDQFVGLLDADPIEALDAPDLTDEQIIVLRDRCKAAGQHDLEDECEAALGLDGKWPDGLYDVRTGRRFKAFEARQRVVDAINMRRNGSNP